MTKYLEVGMGRPAVANNYKSSMLGGCRVNLYDQCFRVSILSVTAMNSASMSLPILFNS